MKRFDNMINFIKTNETGMFLYNTNSDIHWTGTSIHEATTGDKYRLITKDIKPIHFNDILQYINIDKNNNTIECSFYWVNNCHSIMNLNMCEKTRLTKLAEVLKAKTYTLTIVYDNITVNTLKDFIFNKMQDFIIKIFTKEQMNTKYLQDVKLVGRGFSGQAIYVDTLKFEKALSDLLA